jgi:Ni/Fe-hydrogenase subunit HybB-like protein
VEAYGPSEFIWGLLIAFYPYITGLVAGSFIVSTLAHVFGREKFKPISKLALIVTIVFMIVAAMPLIADLGVPGRAFQIFTRLHVSSPMAMFGVVFVSYLALCIIEGYFMFRESLIKRAGGLKGTFLKLNRILALGSSDLSESSLKRDRNVITVLGAIGLPLAALFHAYVGFIFGSVTARSLWTTPLTPVVFLVSAAASGIALLVLISMGMWKYFSKAKVINREVILGLGSLLLWFVVFDFAFNLLEIASRLYAGREEWIAIEFLINGELSFMYLGIQLALGLAIPALILMFGRKSIGAIGISSVLVLIGVLAMRLNIVVGGQLIPRSGQAFITLSSTNPELLVDVFPAIGFFALALCLGSIAVWILPWESPFENIGGKKVK